MSLGLLCHCLETSTVALGPAGQGALGMGKEEMIVFNKQRKERGVDRAEIPNASRGFGSI